MASSFPERKKEKKVEQFGVLIPEEGDTNQKKVSLLVYLRYQKSFVSSPLASRYHLWLKGQRTSEQACRKTRMLALITKMHHIQMCTRSELFSQLTTPILTFHPESEIADWLKSEAKKCMNYWPYCLSPKKLQSVFQQQ